MAVPAMAPPMVSLIEFPEDEEVFGVAIEAVLLENVAGQFNVTVGE
ncbi:Uncharacterised protein [Chlamydia trachomatis]|nr:Uncharacterised protein [Chlamydia trachomatis]CRH88806.1 Uncharacterised protein [Chlamydia trachomatis]CRI74306.1 Uncharacterised protein [Chlamydia trachomatis]